MIAAGRFREDLFYRLNVITITIPPLRERAEDIPDLARHFLAQYGRKMLKPVREFTAEALRGARGATAGRATSGSWRTSSSGR